MKLSNLRPVTLVFAENLVLGEIPILEDTTFHKHIDTENGQSVFTFGDVTAWVPGSKTKFFKIKAMRVYTQALGKDQHKVAGVMFNTRGFTVYDTVEKKEKPFNITSDQDLKFRQYLLEEFKKGTLAANRPSRIDSVKSYIETKLSEPEFQVQDEPQRQDEQIPSEFSWAAGDQAPATAISEPETEVSVPSAELPEKADIPTEPAAVVPTNDPESAVVEPEAQDVRPEDPEEPELSSGPDVLPAEEPAKPAEPEKPEATPELPPKQELPIAAKPIEPRLLNMAELVQTHQAIKKAREAGDTAKVEDLEALLKGHEAAIRSNKEANERANLQKMIDSGQPIRAYIPGEAIIGKTNYYIPMDNDLSSVLRDYGFEDQRKRGVDYRGYVLELNRTDQAPIIYNDMVLNPNRLVISHMRTEEDGYRGRGGYDAYDVSMEYAKQGQQKFDTVLTGSAQDVVEFLRNTIGLQGATPEEAEPSMPSMAEPEAEQPVQPVSLADRVTSAVQQEPEVKAPESISEPQTASPEVSAPPPAAARRPVVQFAPTAQPRQPQAPIKPAAKAQTGVAKTSQRPVKKLEATADYDWDYLDKVRSGDFKSERLSDTFNKIKQSYTTDDLDAANKTKIDNIFKDAKPTKRENIFEVPYKELYKYQKYKNGIKAINDWAKKNLSIDYDLVSINDEKKTVFLRVP